MDPKERRRREDAALLEAAHRSQVDSRTGSVRCLSCGSVFKTHAALAAHLRKHGGVNAVEFKQAKVVATSHAVHTAFPVCRPEVKMRDVMNRKIQKPAKRPKKPELETTETGSGEAKGKKGKMTPMKRMILIQQVLSLRETLSMRRQELESSVERQPECQACNVERKKQMKRLQGSVNAATAELQMALTAVNQKFTFRQLVMIEYLTSQMEWLSSAECEIKSPMMDDACKMDTSLVTDSMLKLYHEAEIIEHEMETLREAEWRTESMRVIETRRDPETGKIFIMRPTFVQASPTLATETVKEQEIIAEEAPPRDVAPSVSREEDAGLEGDAVSMSSQETSSDDDMWGFSDVLTDWAKQTRHLAKTTNPNTHLPILASVDPEQDLSKPASPELDQTPSREGSVRIVHVRKKLEKLPMSSAQTGSFERDEDSAWHDGTYDAGTARCIFIKPLVGVDKVPSKSTPRREKATKTPERAMAPPKEKAAALQFNSSQGNASLDSAVHHLLSQLNSIQHAYMRAATGKANLRWIVSGFSEVNKHLSRGSVKLIIIANHLDASVQPMISETTIKAKEKNVPVVTALTRKKIGTIYHFRKRMSVVAVLDYQNLEDTFATVIALSEKGA